MNDKNMMGGDGMTDDAQPDPMAKTGVKIPLPDSMIGNEGEMTKITVEGKIVSEGGKVMLEAETINGEPLPVDGEATEDAGIKDVENRLTAKLKEREQAYAGAGEKPMMDEDME